MAHQMFVAAHPILESPTPPVHDKRLHTVSNVANGGMQQRSETNFNIHLGLKKQSQSVGVSPRRKKCNSKVPFVQPSASLLCLRDLEQSTPRSDKATYINNEK